MYFYNFFLPELDLPIIFIFPAHNLPIPNKMCKSIPSRSMSYQVFCKYTKQKFKVASVTKIVLFNY